MESVAHADDVSTPTHTTKKPRTAFTVIGDVDPLYDYRLVGASTATLLAHELGPDGSDGNALLYTGLELAADQLSVLIVAMQSEDTLLTPEILAHVARGLEQRIRVLAEIARRVSEGDARSAREAL